MSATARGKLRRCMREYPYPGSESNPNILSPRTAVVFTKGLKIMSRAEAALGLPRRSYPAYDVASALSLLPCRTAVREGIG